MKRKKENNEAAGIHSQNESCSLAQNPSQEIKDEL